MLLYTEMLFICFLLRLDVYHSFGDIYKQTYNQKPALPNNFSPDILRPRQVSK